MATILLVEDNPSILILTQAKLKAYYDILLAHDGQEALDVLEHHKADLIVADVMMPNMDGYQLTQALRKSGSTIPILFLTAKQELEDKRVAFSVGVDDYITKPVNYEKLKWRIAALLRRSRIASERRIVVGDTVLDSDTYTVTSGEVRIDLPKKEFELLYQLLSYPGRIFTRNQLLDNIWGYDSESGGDTVKTHISRLRNRFRDVDDFEILTVKGLGYKAEIKKEGQI